MNSGDTSPDFGTSEGANEGGDIEGNCHLCVDGDCDNCKYNNEDKDLWTDEGNYDRFEQDEFDGFKDIEDDLNFEGDNDIEDEIYSLADEQEEDLYDDFDYPDYWDDMCNEAEDKEVYYENLKDFNHNKKVKDSDDAGNDSESDSEYSPDEEDSIDIDMEGSLDGSYKDSKQIRSFLNDPFGNSRNGTFGLEICVSQKIDWNFFTATNSEQKANKLGHEWLSDLKQDFVGLDGEVSTKLIGRDVMDGRIAY